MNKKDLTIVVIFVIILASILVLMFQGGLINQVVPPIKNEKKANVRSDAATEVKVAKAVPKVDAVDSSKIKVDPVEVKVDAPDLSTIKVDPVEVAASSIEAIAGKKFTCNDYSFSFSKDGLTAFRHMISTDRTGTYDIEDMNGSFKLSAKGLGSDMNVKLGGVAGEILVSYPGNNPFKCVIVSQ